MLSLRGMNETVRGLLLLAKDLSLVKAMKPGFSGPVPSNEVVTEKSKCLK
jgi:hypothetical protein